MNEDALAEGLGWEHPDVAEVRRLARNGAAMIRELHELAHDRPAVDLEGPPVYEEWPASSRG